MNLIEKLTGKENKETKRKKGLKDIEEVINTMAYKHSIPQRIIRDIVWTWMQYQNKRWNID